MLLLEESCCMHDVIGKEVLGMDVNKKEKDGMQHLSSGMWRNLSKRFI